MKGAFRENGGRREKGENYQSLIVPIESDHGSMGTTPLQLLYLPVLPPLSLDSPFQL